MLESHSKVRTSNASRYLQQLCKHWGHRFAVNFDAERGAIDFGGGETLDLSASEGMLHLRAGIAEGGDLSALEQVIADHLRRFAFREDLHIAWTAGTDPGG